MSYDIKKHFPYAEIREQQSLAILYALRNFIQHDKRFVIIEAGTGVGKSAIGLTVGKYLNENMRASGDFDTASWYLTTQKILQAQLKSKRYIPPWVDKPPPDLHVAKGLFSPRAPMPPYTAREC